MTRYLLHHLHAATSVPELGARAGDTVLVYSDGTLYVLRKRQADFTALARALATEALIPLPEAAAPPDPAPRAPAPPLPLRLA